MSSNTYSPETIDRVMKKAAANNARQKAFLKSMTTFDVIADNEEPIEKDVSTENAHVVGEMASNVESSTHEIAD